ncbi:MAG: hypothetical protein KDB88_00320 [Flavobacteriales bacterium]|nr:hypothetical protein [Flavobacteriales bacterium]
MLTTFLRFVGCLLLGGATFVQVVAQDPAQAPVPVQEIYQGHWDLPVPVQTVRTEALSGSTHAVSGPLDYVRLRNLQIDALIRGGGRYGQADLKRITSSVEALERAAAGSLEAHLARYHLEFPSASAFEHADAVRKLDPDHPGVLAPALSAALYRSDQGAIRRAANSFREKGNVAPALWKLAEDVIRCTGRASIVFTTGEMGVYPLVASAARPDDLLVVDARLLDDRSYRERIWSLAGAAGKVGGSGPAFAHALARASNRPVHLALGLDPSWFTYRAMDLHLTGLTYTIGAQGPEVAVLLERWQQMHRTAEAGPLSWNYLLLGSVLVEHYRRLEDEAITARLTMELRDLARQLGAEPSLIRAGVLLH